MLILSLMMVCLMAAGIVNAIGTWETKASMPTARVYAAGATIGNDFYVVGGAPLGQAATNKLEVYDSITNSWTTKAPSNLVRTSMGAGAVNGKLYVISGCINSDCRATYTNQVEEYNPGTNTWTFKANMPTPRIAAVVTVDNKIYAIGGTDLPCPGSSGGCTPSRVLEVYDPLTNSWTAKAPIPVDLSSPQAAVIDGKIYVVGGDQPAWGVPAKFEVYDPATDTWSTETPLPSQRNGFTVEALNGKIYVSGGSESTGNPPAMSLVEVYDPTTGTWSTEAPMSQIRYGHVSGVIDNKIYTVGGWDTPFTRLNSLEVFTPEIVEPVCVDAPSNMVSWWDADDVAGATAIDIQSGKDGTMMNGAAIVPGKVGEAFSFDGINDYVVANSRLDTAEGYTIDFWMKPRFFRESPIPIIMRSGGVWTQNQFEFMIHLAGTQTWGAGKDRIQFQVAYPTSSGNSAWVKLVGPVIPENDWTHVASTYDAVSLEVKLYVNGVLVDSKDVTQELANQGFTPSSAVTEERFTFGADYWADRSEWFPAGQAFPGELDEIELFSRSLTSGEIQSIYDAGSAGKCKEAGVVCGDGVCDAGENTVSCPADCLAPQSDLDGDGIPDDVDACNNPDAPNGLVSYWGFEENEGTTADDSYDNNVGTIAGATYTSGQVNGALSFNGNNAVDIAPSSSLAMSDSGTIEAWVQRSNWNPDPWSAVTIFTNNLWYQTTNSVYLSQNYGGLAYAGSTGLHFRYGGTYQSGNTYLKYGDADFWSPNSWHHVVATWDRLGSTTYLNLYADGQLVDSLTTSLLINMPSPTWSIGRYVGAQHMGGWDGLIDEVAFYNQALSLAEVQEHYNNGLVNNGYCESIVETTCFGLPFDDPNVCSGNGICANQDYCVCDADYTGMDCSIEPQITCFGLPFDDPNVCSGNGICANQDYCVCDADYTGMDCSRVADLDLDGYTLDIDCDDSDANIYPGADDSACDAVDNDCNGLVDDGYVTTLTSCGVGACAASGTLQCVAGSEVNSCTAGTPVVEVCDNLDNDCDGTTDEDLTQSTNELGACAVNTETCSAGVYVVDSQYVSQAEICNAVDDDCDGIIDELACDDDNDGIPNENDVCPGGDDLIDGDADGVADFCDACPLNNPDDTDGDGICDSDDNDYTSQGSDVEVNPIPEVTLTFSSVTSAGTTTVTTTSAGPPAPTQFRLGNPATFYDITTTSGYESPVTVCLAYSGVSYPNEQKLKLMHFSDGWIDITNPGYPDMDNQIICGTTPSFSYFAVMELIDDDNDGYTLDVDCNDLDETVNPGADDSACDGKDNDCDGLVDNGYVTTPTNCGVGACATSGTLQCVAGSEVNSCTAGTPAIEVCDNLDNDCDGTTDEDLTQSTICGVGACGSNTGYETCTAGSWSGNTCNPYAGATTDDVTCDNVDNDCDASVDEDYVSQATSCGVGVCAATGQTSCVAGNIQDSCTAGTPAIEVCDNLDNDCDGTTDEGCEISEEDYIEQEILALENMDLTGKAQKSVDNGIKDLNKAIDAFNQGKTEKAIGKIEKAVRDLMKAQKQDADTQRVIDNLVELVKGITDKVLVDAIEMAGINNKNVVKAQKHYEEALENLAEGKYDKAIKEFKNALKDAEKALK